MPKKLLLVALLLCGSSLSVQAADPIKIGFNVPLTGFAAADGNSAKIGAELAVEQANAAGGINGQPVELVIYDDQAAAKEAVSIATKLIERDQVPVAVSGSYSGSTRAAAGIFQEAGVPYIAAYAVHPDITRAGDYIFRTSFVGEVQGRAGAKLIGESLGLKKVSLITLNNDFGTSLANGFKSAAGQFGIEIVSEYEYSIKDRQFGPIVAKIKADAPTAIYASGYFFTAGPLVSQLRSAGVEVPVIGQEGYDSEKFIEIAGPAAEGVIITTSLDRDSEQAEAQAFIQAFEQKAGFKADMVAASGHTAVNVAIEALRKAGPEDRQALRDAIAATDMNASTGHISFNSLGEVRKAAQIQVVRDGAWHRHSIIDDVELLAPPAE
ncbi:MAG: ABC transporter substrate-binding protein [Candidatus Competibacteraceae bacterium]|nr:ABC transporter substrate-binding protein [Candidatus Competibacteraceae bacterium]MCB1804790.1 ABC transporter substrate-binding protein [Candidatus Competibacteraceae bacterium]MCB1810432.1 ABC transporter substrate-binding protein [Candidatus Competibacteraceae bacterium]